MISSAVEGVEVVAGVEVEALIAQPEWGLDAGDRGLVIKVSPSDPTRLSVDWGDGSGFSHTAYTDEVRVVGAERWRRAGFSGRLPGASSVSLGGGERAGASSG